MKCIDCVHFVVCGKSDYEADRKDCIDFIDDEKLILHKNYIGKKVKVACNSWGYVRNAKTIELGTYLVGEIVSITRTKRQTLIKIRAEHILGCERPTKRYPMSAIGKTVFLLTEKGE